MAKVTIKKIELDMNLQKNTCKIILHGSNKKKYTLLTEKGLVAVGELDD
jgi:hypothetical protein